MNLHKAKVRPGDGMDECMNGCSFFSVVSIHLNRSYVMLNKSKGNGVDIKFMKSIL